MDIEHVRNELEDIEEALKGITKLVYLVQLKARLLEGSVKDEIDAQQHLRIVNG